MDAPNSTTSGDGVPSVFILNFMSRWYVRNAPLQIAPWFIGTFLELFLQGILVTQTSNYFSYRDPTGRSLPFVWLVIVLNILCALKSAQNIKIVWDVMIANYANPDTSLRLIATSWTTYTPGLFTAIIAVYVQSFFVYRYYLLTKRWWVCLFIATGMVLSLVSCILAVYYIPPLKNSKIRLWSLVHFVSAIIVDTLITSLTAWHLYRQKSSIRSTSELIDRLLRMVWQTALPPTICVIVNAAVLEARPIETSHIIFNSVLPKLYANSLLYTLNSRNEIRSRQTSPLSTGYHITTSASGRGGAATATTMTTRNSTVGRVDLSVFGREEDTSSRGGATSPTAGDGREERRVSIRFEEEARKPEVFEFARLDLKSGEISDADGK